MMQVVGKKLGFDVFFTFPVTAQFSNFLAQDPLDGRDRAADEGEVASSTPRVSVVGASGILFLIEDSI